MTIRISPQGARILIKLYLNGDLILKKGKCITHDVSDLTVYANKEEYYQKRLKELEEKDKWAHYLMKHPEEIKESDFSYYLLNAVFIEKFGCTSNIHTISLDGFDVTKMASVYKSNSGKSQDSEVTIFYINSHGEKINFTKESLYQGNRRNDEERNWGLPK